MLTPITVLYAAIFGLMLMVLSGRLPIARRKFRIGIGTGGNAELARMIRVQGNFTEYVPMALLLMLLNEMNAPHAMLLHASGIALLLGRLIHALGLGSNAGTSFGRFWGTTLTWTVITFLSGRLLLISVS